MARVLVLGSGGREHAIAWKLALSDSVQRCYICPGNAGTTDDDKILKPKDFPDASNFPAIASWCKRNDITLVCVGAEAPLAAGIADALRDNGVKVFGPSKAASQIESSKTFAKNLMDKYGIPTAQWKSFTEYQEAVYYVNSLPSGPLVVKADGLAAGKGVVIAQTELQALNALRDVMSTQKYGTAGTRVVVEEFLDGFEVSMLCFTDGKTIRCMPPSQDHKKLLEGDKGPNTGGMGAYCPTYLIDTSVCLELESIMRRTVEALSLEDKPFTGVLYGGFMITQAGPKVLEFNCRFGDPETQVLLPLLTSDLLHIMMACSDGTLAEAPVDFRSDRTAVSVVVASQGYPGSYAKGKRLTVPRTMDDSLVFHAGTALSSDGSLVTSGGRVLACVAVRKTLDAAVQSAYEMVDKVKFEGCFYRKDIAAQALAFMSSPSNPTNPPDAPALEADPALITSDAIANSEPTPPPSGPITSDSMASSGLSYASSGVDIVAGSRLISAIAPVCRASDRLGCVGGLGMFGSVFDVKLAGYEDPLLISGTDGVGTKLMVAQSVGRHASIGIDLVAMCANDVLCHGAEPLYFLDYFATGKLDVQTAKQVIEGIAEGCTEAGCALVGGETAEMAGMYPPGKYDLAGFCVAAVDRKLYLPRPLEGDAATLSRIPGVSPDDLVIGLSSSGLHSNGFSLVRKLIQLTSLSYEDTCPWQEETTVGEALLTPTKLYIKQVLPSLKAGLVKAAAHITGGGLVENIPRILPDTLTVNLDASRWKIPSVFSWIHHQGNVSEEEMLKTFNCGIGFVLIVSPDNLQQVLENTEGLQIGHLSTHASGDGPRVKVVNLTSSLKSSLPENLPASVLVNSIKVKCAVLISGTGTNLQALIGSCSLPESHAQIVLVISNKEGVQGLERAQAAGIPTQVVSHLDYASRQAFDDVITARLKASGVQLICLAGFMRILSGKFVSHWKNRIMNVHPSLLPSFKGVKVHEQVLKSGVKLSGCTVHLVEEEVDSGEILEQEGVAVLPGDSAESLQERVKIAEHLAYPRALQNYTGNRREFLLH